jgi:hypothetical protein
LNFSRKDDIVDVEKPNLRYQVFSFSLSDFRGKMDLEIAVAVLGRIWG